MTKLITIKVSNPSSGNTEVDYTKHVNLTDLEFNEAIAFSSPALLAHQLSSLNPKMGSILTSRIQESIHNSKFGTKESKFSSLESSIILFSRTNNIQTKVKHKAGLFAPNIEERTRDLVSNYTFFVLRQELTPYNGLLRVALMFICSSYKETAKDPEVFFQPGISPKLRNEMLQLSTSLYSLWRGDLNIYLKELEKKSRDNPQ